MDMSIPVILIMLAVGNGIFFAGLFEYAFGEEAEPIERVEKSEPEDRETEKEIKRLERELKRM